MSKKIIRKKIINLRKIKYNRNSKINFSKFISIIKNKKIFKKSIGGYYPVNFEIDDLDILKNLEKKKFKISLPVIEKNNEMNFYKWSFNDNLVINKYGIPEPEKNKLIYPDILIVPLVAFDKRRFRLGYGGGYYDRYIAKLSKKKRFLTLGLAFSSQKINKVPNDKYDKRLDIILTDRYILK